MGDGRDEGRLCRIQFLELGDVFQEDNVADVLADVFLPVRQMDGNVLYLEITFFVISINFERLLLFVGLHQFAHEASQEIVFQRQFGG